MRPKPFGFHRPGTHQATPAAHLSAAILDSQSVKTTDRGPYSCDDAKRLQRRKRHLLVDTLSLVGKVQVIAADVGRPRPLLDWTRQRRGMAFQVMQHRHGGHKLRWLPPGATPPIVVVRGGPAAVVVERTFAWLGRFRWLSKGYEIGRVSQLLWRSLKAAREVEPDLACSHHRHPADRRRPRPPALESSSRRPANTQRITLASRSVPTSNFAIEHSV